MGASFYLMYSLNYNYAKKEEEEEEEEA